MSKNTMKNQKTSRNHYSSKSTSKETSTVSKEMSIKILVVEDDDNLREALSDTLILAKYDVMCADCAEEALKLLMLTADIGMIVSDVNMGKMSGHDLLREVKKKYPQIPMLLITAYASINDSVEAMKLGAVDYLVKPFEPEALVQTVARHVGGNIAAGADEPVAISMKSQKLLQLARRIAQSETTALIIGESGTGKEVLARYIHLQSTRAEKPFIAINCAAIPENMMEAMLFGHEKGAYTGAHTSAPGKFEQANEGTLLLDEISEMDVGLQAKLLRVLQENEVERLGGRKTIDLDVRVIATSNRDLRQAVADGRFREDLYFRLCILPLQWAPLRDRPEDIMPLAERLLAKHAKKQRRRAVVLGHTAKRALLGYLWPGNVRELDNVMQRALILQPGTEILEEDLGLNLDIDTSPKPSLIDPLFAGGKMISSELHTLEAIPMNPLLESTSSQVSEMAQSDDSGSFLADVSGAVLGADLKKREFEIIVSTLKQVHGSKKSTAEKLGISPRTLRYKMARLREEGFNIEAALAG